MELGFGKGLEVTLDNLLASCSGHEGERQLFAHARVYTENVCVRFVVWKAVILLLMWLSKGL